MGRLELPEYSASDGDGRLSAGTGVEYTEVGVDAHVSDDRRIAIDLERQSGLFSSALRSIVKKQISDAVLENENEKKGKNEKKKKSKRQNEKQSQDQDQDQNHSSSFASSSKPAPPPYEEHFPLSPQDASSSATSTKSSTPQNPPAPLNIVMHVVGSRGDVQPFVALAKTLRTAYNHRVRIATHPIFKSFIEESGAEFFSIGGNPQELMAFMVRSPGLLPSFEVLRSGDVGRQKKMIKRLMEGCWRSCIEEGDGLGNEEGELEGEKRRVANDKSFVADVILANPPSFAHVHCAQKLGVPVHLMFTMPWSSTQSFPHPLANIKSSNTDLGVVNYISYALVETLMWQGLGSIHNRFRYHILGLEPIRLPFGPRMLSRLKIPHTYCWSPSLIPKPQDWGSHISVAGFYFMNRTTEYNPDPALASFLLSGSTPIYVGFGSIVVDNPEALTQKLFDAIKLANVRAVVSKGWGGLGSNQLPRNVFLIGDVPHDWLFLRVSAVVHHGGAGTTAAAMAAGKPSVIVPFFGDQFFWGDMLQKAGAGSKPIPAKQLTHIALAAAIIEVLQPAVLERAMELGRIIGDENGTEAGCASLHQQTEVQCMKCSLTPNRIAVWKVKKKEGLHLSAFAATVLLNARILRVQDLKLLRQMEYDVESGPWDPITGVVSACLGMVGDMAKSLGDIPIAVGKANEAHPLNGTLSRKSRNVATGTLVGSSKGVGRILLAGFRSPFEVMLLAARGFHNAPALYGDETVRPAERITGIVSGFGAMGKEIGFSLYDAISGLVLCPLNGARREGLVGFGKGLGIGVGGFILKPVAALWGVGGYTYEGLNKELEKLFGSSIQGHIALARLAQGSKEFNIAQEEEIGAVLGRWEGCAVK